MSVSRVKVWIAGEVLSASDLNAEFANLITNGEDLGWPATKAKDLDGNELIFDADGDTSITSDSDDVIDFRIGGTDSLFIGHGTGNTVGFLTVDPLTMEATASTDFGIVRVGNTNAITVPAGTTAIAAGVYIETPNWTATGTITESAALYIQGAATEGATDYALIVDAGNSRFDGSVDINGNELIFDADGDTSLTSDTDDEVDYRVGGRDVQRMTVNGWGDEGIYAKNKTINGDFIVAQQGTSFTSATTPANNDDTYLFDQWILLSDGNDVVDVTQETSVTPEARAAIRFDVETANKKFGILQIIENENAREFLAGTVSLSFQARRTGTSINNLRAAVIAWDSTADSVTSDVVSAWNAAGSNPTLVTNWTYENTPVSLATLSTSYSLFRIENISVDTASAANVAVFIWSDDTTTTAGDFLYIANVQLEIGEIATPFEQRPVSLEEDLSRWYFERLNFDNLDDVGYGGCQSTTTIDITLHFQPKRIQPAFSTSTDSNFSGRVTNTIAAIATVTFFQANTSPFDRGIMRGDGQTVTAGEAGNIQSNTDGAFLEIDARL